MTEFKVNEYLTLKLDEGKTNIYIKNEVFTQCKHLKLMELANIEPAFINPETNFWGHCSVIQAWAENNYSLDLLDKHFAFLLLNKLLKAGDLMAMKVLISLTHCIYCDQELTREDVYCPNCRKHVNIPHLSEVVNKRVIEFFNNAQFEKAIDILKMELKVDTQDIGALGYLAHSFSRFNQNRKALKIYQKIETIDPTHINVHINILFLYIQVNKFNKAMTLSEELVEKHPEVIQYHLYRGFVHASMGKYIRAKESYDKAFDFAKKRPYGANKIPPSAYFWLGRLFNEMYEFKNAMDTITRGLVRYKNDINLIFTKSLIYFRTGDYDKAMHLLIELKRTNPKVDHDAINLLIGQIYLDKGQYYKAIKCFQKSINSSIYLSVLYNRRRMYRKAIPLCEEAIRFYRDNANTWETLGIFHANAKELDRAKRAINMAIALNPYSNTIKLSLAYIYIKNEEYDKAITICNKILEHIPKHFFGRLYMGYAFFGKGNFEKAMEFIKKALEIDANSDKAKYWLAKIYFNQKNFNEAIYLIKSRLNPYSRDFFELVVEIIKALKSHKICPDCSFFSKKRSNFCNKCGSHFEKAA